MEARARPRSNVGSGETAVKCDLFSCPPARPHTAAAPLCTDLFSPTGLVKDPEMAKVLYWTTCSGESPVSALVTAVTASADAVTNVGGTGFWDDVAGSGST